MELYLLRHAEAGEALRDEERELTSHGREQAAAVACGLAALHLDITLLLSSPLTRAVQTAEPVAGSLGLRLETAEALATGRSAAEAIDLAAAASGRVLLVGHEPQLSTIVVAVCGGRVRMRKAMLARLELDPAEPSSGRLVWLLAWQHLKRFA